jgi:hypothetical protein
MIDKDARVVAETVFERAQRREREIDDALKIEEERHAAMIENMHRLRTLRLSRGRNLRASQYGWRTATRADLGAA